MIFVRISVKDIDNHCLVAHFDGKIVSEFSEGRKLNNHRVSLSVSSPALETPQLLGVPVVETSSGAHQTVEVVKLLKDWGVWENLIALCFDTTSDNTGRVKGACTRIEKEMGFALLWLACQRHVFEVHIK